MTAFSLLLDLSSGSLSSLDWGKLILIATGIAFVVAIVRTCIYVDRKYLSDGNKKKKRRGK